MGQPDSKAVQTARAVHHELEPRLTILFGSRARGDHRQDSDIDLLLLEPQPPDQDGQETATSRAEETARRIYGHHVPVQLIWRTPEEFRERRRYVNSVETRAARGEPPCRDRKTTPHTTTRTRRRSSSSTETPTTSTCGTPNPTWKPSRWWLRLA